MSNSRVYKVPDDLHPNVESAYMAFRTKNPILSMGANERKRLLREYLQDPNIAAAVEMGAPPPPWAKELGFDPDDDFLLKTLHRYPEAHPFLKLVRGWPRSERERLIFARRTKYSTFVTQMLQQASGQEGTHHGKFTEGTDGWDPSTARTIARKAFL